MAPMRGLRLSSKLDDIVVAVVPALTAASDTPLVWENFKKYDTHR